MRAIVQGEWAAAGHSDVLPLITTSVVTDEEGIAETGGRTWRFMLADDESGGTRATVTGWEAAAWVG